MHKITIAVFSLILAVLPAFAGDRLIPQTVDTSTARVQPQAIGFFRGESVTYTVTPRYGSAAIAVSTNATAYWTACYASNINAGVINVTGTVTTAGVATFSLAVTNTLMPAGTYDSFVRIQDGASLVTASRSSLTVFKSPYAGTTAFPSLSFLEPLWAAASNSVVRTNQMGSGATWTGSNWTWASSSYTFANTNLLAGQVVTNGATVWIGTNAASSGISAPEGTNISAAVTASMMLTGSVATATSAGAVTGSQSNTIATAVQPAALSGYMPTGSAHSTLSGILGSGSLHVSDAETNLIYGALQSEADTLQTVVDRGNTATNLGEVSMVGNLQMGTNRVVGNRFGSLAGQGASIISGGAYGHYAGMYASGSGFNAYGTRAGNYSIGVAWGAYGYYAGYEAVHTNSHILGNYAGRTAIGNNRMYLDVYSADPSYAADGATNDTIFMDSDGKLYLGGGAARSENPSAGGVLRGTWTGGNFTAAGVGASPTGHVHAAGDVTNLQSTVAGYGYLTNITPAQVAAAGGLTNVSINGTLFNVVGGVATGSVAAGSGGGFTNYVPAYSLWSSPTTTITRAMGELVKLTCTSAVALLTIDNTGWDTNGAGRVSVDLYGNNNSIGFDTSVITNSTLLDISTNANVCTPLFFRRPAGGTIWRVRQ